MKYWFRSYFREDSRYSNQYWNRKEETLGSEAFSVKRAVILNNIGFETGNSFEIVSQCKYGSPQK